VRITAKVKATQLVRTIRKFPQMVKKNGEQILRTEGRSFAKELARQTLPVGLNDDAYQRLAKKIRADVRRAVIAPARLYRIILFTVNKDLADEIWKVICSGDGKRHRTLAQLIKSVPKVAQLACSGRMQAQWVKVLRTNGWGGVPTSAEPQGVVTDEKAIATFISKMCRRIGMAKAGWAAAGRSISGRNVQGIPQWASFGRHKVSGEGIYDKKQNRIRLINPVRHARKALPPSLEAVAKRQAARNLHLHLLHMINAQIKQDFRGQSKAA